MRYIKKTQVPKSLSIWKANRKKANQVLSYEEIPKDEMKEIKKILLKEQYHLCAYCMRRITDENMTIEHIEPRKLSKIRKNENEVDYYNMVAVCNGTSIEEGGKKHYHCDKTNGKKGKSDGSVELNYLNPTKKKVERFITYSKDWSIIPALGDNDKGVEEDIEEKLNLNNEVLKKNRRAAIQDLQTSMLHEQNQKGNKDKTWSKKIYQDKLNKIQSSAEGKLPSFVGAISHYLNKKISKSV